MILKNSKVNFYKIALVYWFIFGVFEFIIHSKISRSGDDGILTAIEAMFFIVGVILTVLSKKSLDALAEEYYDNQYQQKIKELASRTTTMGSKEYFSVLTRHILDTVKCDYVIIGELKYTENTQRPYIATKSVRSKNREYLPSEFLLQSLDRTIAVDDITSDDLAKITKNFVSSYLNMPLTMQDESIHGILSCVWVDKKKLPSYAKNILEIFARQCQSEMERLIVEEKLEYQANHDVLTKLPNRNCIMTKLNEIVDSYDDEAVPLKFYNVYFIDLDDFKEVNDEFGHEAGDTLLLEISQRIKSCVRENDIVARLGGDEFIIVEEGCANNRQNSLVDRVISQLQQVVYLEDNVTVTVTASVGYLSIPEDSRSVEEILRYADFAMYYAKSLGKNVGVRFTQELFTDSQNEKFIETRLINAIENNEIDIAIQPIVDHERNIIKGEVLARWQTNDISLSIEDIVNVAERRGLINAFSKNVFEKALEYCSNMKYSEGIYIRLAINCSPILFKDPGFVSYLVSIFDEYQVSPKQVTLEITESVASKYKEILPTIVELKNRGFTLALDDFGKGYSSLSFLETLPVDIVKLDRALVTDAVGNVKKSTLLRAVSEICKTYEYKLVAEGIETKKDFDFLKDMGYDYMQGYYFSRPISVKEYTQLLKKEK